MKLTTSYLITGQIEILTGLHIGAGKDAVEIGGVDNPVVKNPYTGEPYIPGSSLKGKLRCLMEWVTGCVEDSGKTWEGGGETGPDKLAADPILRIFGTTSKNWDAGPTRLIVRDACLNKEWKERIIDRGLPLTEEKFENNIDRIQGKAGPGIRKTERVPAGSLFDFEMVYRIFDTNDEGRTDVDNLDNLFAIMRLLEQDALGGSGSRGYGRIRFDKLKKDGQDIQAKFESIDVSKLIKQQKVA
ncbi:type III-A CRISPR-associated RAMP protein Csm3 [Desulfosudis oleivorans]|uniref:CRISPR system Cms endoribonuclease Csm3 n=1 Tax=Desulfosudis oleivorans (strain DSM 6200 / JCM 39069 / Hxd3) TaxID=96561 RepID=A8ZV91_DESOH|nr:type III-A CRISPR-associated RAMP protein Csm3 [Desulfosudis oleivorans]ABW66552.1 CRISPR-associated RAMP protein, Csm3 family [Desulfosudis oleivorans Hxd3]